MTLDELNAKVEAYQVTDADIEAMQTRLEAASKQFAQEARDKQPTWDWYHHVCNI